MPPSIDHIIFKSERQRKFFKKLLPYISRICAEDLVKDVDEDIVKEAAARFHADWMLRIERNEQKTLAERLERLEQQRSNRRN